MDKKKKIIAALVPNLLMTLWAFIVLLKVIDSNELWRMLFASIGFIGFFSFSVLLVLQLMKISEVE